MKKKVAQIKVMEYVRSNDLVRLNDLLINHPTLDLNFLDEKNFSPLHCAAVNDHVEITELLLDRGAKIDFTEPKVGASSLHFCRSNKMVSLLLKRGAKIEATDNFNSSALHYAALANNSEVAMELMSQGIDVNARCLNGETAKDMLLDKIFTAGAKIGCTKKDGEDEFQYHDRLIKVGKFNSNFIQSYNILSLMNNCLARTSDWFEEREQKHDLYATKAQAVENIPQICKDGFIEANQNTVQKYQKLFNQAEGQSWSQERKNAELLKFIYKTCDVLVEYYNPPNSFVKDPSKLSDEEAEMMESFGLSNSAGLLRMMTQAIHSLSGELRGEYADKLPFKSNPWHRLEIFGKIVVPLGGVDNDFTVAQTDKESLIVAYAQNQNHKNAMARLRNDFENEIVITEAALPDIIREDLPNLRSLIKHMFDEIRGVSTKNFNEIKLDNIEALTGHITTSETAQKLLLWTLPDRPQILYDLPNNVVFVPQEDLKLSSRRGEINYNFTLNEARGDGDCGFRSLLGGEFLQGAINRNEIITKLNDAIDDTSNLARLQKVKNLIAIDIEQRYQEYISGNDVLEAYFPPQLKTLFDNLKAQETASNLGGSAREEFYQQQIRPNFSDQTHIKTYLNNYLTGHANYQEVWPMLGGVMDAAAECLNKQVNYWHIVNNKLELLHSNQPLAAGAEAVNILHRGIHFDRLNPSVEAEILPTQNQKVPIDFMGDFELALALQMSFDRLNDAGQKTDRNDFARRIDRERRILSALHPSPKEEAKNQDHTTDALINYPAGKMGFNNRKQTHALLRRLQYVGEFLTEQHLPSSMKNLVADIDLSSFRTLRDGISHPWDRNNWRVLNGILADYDALSGMRNDLVKFNNKILTILEKRYDEIAYNSNENEMWKNIKSQNQAAHQVPKAATKKPLIKADFAPQKNLLPETEIADLLANLRKPSGAFFKDAAEVQEVKDQWDEILRGKKPFESGADIRQYFPSKKENAALNKKCCDAYKKSAASFDDFFIQHKKDLEDAKKERLAKTDFPAIRNAANQLDGKMDFPRPSKLQKAKIAQTALKNLKNILHDEFGTEFPNRKNDFIHKDPKIFGKISQKTSEDIELRYALEYNLYLLLEMSLAVTKYKECDQSLKDQASKIEKDRKYLAHGDAILDSAESKTKKGTGGVDMLFGYQIVNYIYDLESGLNEVVKKLPNKVVSTIVTNFSALNLAENTAVKSATEKSWAEKMVSSSNGKGGVTKEM